MRRSIIAVAFALVGAVCLSLYPAWSQAQVRIGVVGPLTGPVAVGGLHTKNGVELATEEINGRGGIPGVGKIELMYEDDKCIPPESVNATTKLVHRDKVVAVIGSICSSATLASMVVTQKAETPQLVPVASSPAITAKGNKWIFRTSITDAINAATLADFTVKTLNEKRVGIVHDADDFGRDGADAYQRNLETLGVKPLVRESFNRKDKDFSAQLLKVKSAGAKVLVVWGLPEEAALIVKQAKDLDVGAVPMGGDPLSSPRYRQLAGPAAEGTISAVIFAAAKADPRAQEFVRKYEGKYKEEVDTVAASSYDMLHLLAKALEKAGTDRAKLRDALAAISHEGVTGKIEFDQYGSTTSKPIVVQTKGGKLIPYGQ